LIGLTFCDKVEKYQLTKEVKMTLKKAEKKVSLNIKVSHELDARLKRARSTARQKGMIFNVSEFVENQLEKELKKVEKNLSINTDIKEEILQNELFGKPEEV
jgi:post-segregation antitoxin (ccd killing protein)